MADKKLQGFGLGMRPSHYDEFLGGQVPVDFIEVISENFMVDGGRPLHILDRVRNLYPVALHGVSMSLGSADGVDIGYLRQLRTLVDRIDPVVVSDHLCWTRIEGFNSHDLLPLPYTREALEIVCANIGKAQDILGRTMLIENPSTYLEFSHSEMNECTFLDEMSARTGCFLLLDVNNIFVNAINHRFDPLVYLNGIPADRVRQIHLAGHSQGKELLIDTHDQPVPSPVWALYEKAIQLIGPVATMIERDDNIPPLTQLLDELAIARDIANVAHGVIA